MFNKNSLKKNIKIEIDFNKSKTNFIIYKNKNS